jgi:hypothetical protein
MSASDQYRGPGVYFIDLGTGSVATACNGSQHLGSDGSSASRIATSCVSVYRFFGVDQVVIYIDFTFASPPDSSRAIQVYCEAGNVVEGDGLTKNSPLSSCRHAMVLRNYANASVYIDQSGSQPPRSSNAMLVHCLNGINQGGNGSNLQTSASSCQEVMNYWKSPAGSYFIQGVRR